MHRSSSQWPDFSASDRHDLDLFLAPQRPEAETKMKGLSNSVE
jgi:hypothetical protein